MYERALSSLIKIEPALKSVCADSTLSATDDPAFPIAAVTVVNSKIHIILSAHKFSKLKGYEKTAVLAHEYAHPLLGHLDIRKLESEDSFLAGIAHDLAVNSLLSKFRLPKTFILPEHFGFKPKLSAEAYLASLVQLGKPNLLKLVRLPATNPAPQELLESNQVIRNIVSRIPKSAYK